MAHVIHADPHCEYYLQHIQQQQKHQHQHPSSQSHARRGGAQSSDDEGLRFLQRKRKEIIDRSMAVLVHGVNTWLEHSLGERLDPGVVGGRKRARGGSPEEDEGRHEVDGPGKGAEVKTGRAVRSTKKRMKKEEDEEGPRLACPFCVHDPERYGKVKTCMGPGWPKAHRVKEHVYRSHAMPKNMCSRCYEPFEDEAALKQHQRSKDECVVKDECDAPDGFTEAQEKQLRTRSSGGTEVEKWQEMYRILFPNDEPKSPYYHEIVYNSSGLTTQKPTQLSTKEECKQFLLIEITRLARPLIEEAVDKELEMVQQNMYQKAADIVKTVENKMMRTFKFVAPHVADEEDDETEDRQLQIPPPAPTPPPAGDYGAVGLSSSAMDMQLGPIFQQQEVLEWFNAYTNQGGLAASYPPVFDLNLFNETGKATDYQSNLSNIDSAYYTGTSSTMGSDSFGNAGYQG